MHKTPPFLHSLTRERVFGILPSAGWSSGQLGWLITNRSGVRIPLPQPRPGLAGVTPPEVPDDWLGRTTGTTSEPRGRAAPDTPLRTDGSCDEGAKRRRLGQPGRRRRLWHHPIDDAARRETSGA